MKLREPIEDIVTVELGWMAKSRGFNRKTTSVWLDEEEQFHHYSVVPLDWNRHDDMVSLPSLSNLQKWLREEFDVHVIITPEYYEDGFTWNVQVLWWLGEDNPHKDITTYGGTMSYGDSGNFDSYEHALENGLRLAIKRMEYPMNPDYDMTRDEIIELNNVLIGYDRE